MTRVICHWYSANLNNSAKGRCAIYLLSEIRFVYQFAALFLDVALLNLACSLSVKLMTKQEVVFLSADEVTCEIYTVKDTLKQ